MMGGFAILNFAHERRVAEPAGHLGQRSSSPLPANAHRTHLTTDAPSAVADTRQTSENAAIEMPVW